MPSDYGLPLNPLTGRPEVKINPITMKSPLKVKKAMEPIAPVASHESTEETSPWPSIARAAERFVSGPEMPKTQPEAPTGPPQMRPSTWREKLSDTVRDVTGALGENPAGKITDTLGITNFKGGEFLSDPLNNADLGPAANLAQVGLGRIPNKDLSQRMLRRNMEKVQNTPGLYAKNEILEQMERNPRTGAYVTNVHNYDNNMQLQSMLQGDVATAYPYMGSASDQEISDLLDVGFITRIPSDAYESIRKFNKPEYLEEMIADPTHSGAGGASLFINPLHRVLSPGDNPAVTARHEFDHLAGGARGSIWQEIIDEERNKIKYGAMPTEVRARLAQEKMRMQLEQRAGRIDPSRRYRRDDQLLTELEHLNRRQNTFGALQTGQEVIDPASFRAAMEYGNKTLRPRGKEIFGGGSNLTIRTR